MLQDTDHHEGAEQNENLDEVVDLNKPSDDTYRSRNLDDTAIFRLLIVNAVFFVLHTFHAFILVAVAYWWGKMTVSVTTAYNQTTIKPVLKLQLGPSAGIYSLISAVHHLIILILIWRKKYYKEWIESGRGYFRWYEYGFSLGAMIISCAFTSGITDLGYLVLLFILNFAIHWLYASHDKVNFLLHKNHERQDWHYLVLSLICQFFMWLVLYMSFLGRNAQGLVPFWAILILVFTNALYLCNIGNLILQHLYVGPWFYGEFTETVYSVTGFVLKFIVSWLVFGYSCTSFE